MNETQNTTNKRHALIIGASSGIGREMALILAKKGWRVTAAGRRAELLDELRTTSPQAISSVAFDANRVDEIPARLDAAVTAFGDIDLFVISAGTGFLNPQLESSLEQATIDTNVRGFTALADWAFLYFKKKGGGKLAAITSVGGLIGEGAAPAYPASKAYQITYMESLRKRAKKEAPGLSVIEIRPGSVNTAMMKGEGHFWISTPEYAAALACQAIEKGKRLQYVSRRWRLIGTILRLLGLPF